jgi:hypothetical protein
MATTQLNATRNGTQMAIQLERFRPSCRPPESPPACGSKAPGDDRAEDRALPDHPRIEFLRRKGLFAGKEWPLAKWMHSKQALDRVMGVWRDAAPLTEFLDAHVGPSTLPPDDFDR